MAGIVYNVTVTISSGIEEEWVKWMRNKHIPDVLKTGCFEGHKFLKLVEGHHGPDPTFAVQYFCGSRQDLENYHSKFSEKLQKEHQDKFEGQFAAFRTVLEDIS